MIFNDTTGCSQLALDSINQLAGRYLRHLGKTFRLLMDRNDPNIGPEVSQHDPFNMRKAYILFRK